MRERFKGRPHTGKKRGTLVAALTFYQENESRPLGEYMYGPQYLEIREQNRLREWVFTYAWLIIVFAGCCCVSPSLCLRLLVAPKQGTITNCFVDFIPSLLSQT
ncbi:uncharacterized protein LOC113310419 isoform X4 [Papaver somniferum]|uniref:uncharacterized protein LOC113310419 isoform X4 n=1 Tax=Papaver somniferum TaxID=3469 RepID=UPI000E6FF673|nr:uncharacterized protein LOC113310419 isoform X4 [Papaver somniferum]